jgi:hypothetical protein
MARFGSTPTPEDLPPKLGQALDQIRALFEQVAFVLRYGLLAGDLAAPEHFVVGVVPAAPLESWPAPPPGVLLPDVYVKRLMLDVYYFAHFSPLFRLRARTHDSRLRPGEAIGKTNSRAGGKRASQPGSMCEV